MFKIVKSKICLNRSCKKKFEITEIELNLLNKFDIQDLPELCPNCRHQAKLSFCGFVNFCKRQSALSGKSIVSVYNERNKFPVYAIQEWWNDDHDPLKFGIDFNFNKDFFEQFSDLSDQVPRMSNSVTNCENSDYASYVGNSKNIYYSSIVFGSCEDIYYSDAVTDKCLMLSDCLRVYKSSYAYEAIQCSNIHYSAYLLNCINCRDCFYSYDLIGCNDCLFSYGLRNKKYCIFNKELSQLEYNKQKLNFLDGSYKKNIENIHTWYKIIAEAPTKAVSQTSTENCIGSGLLTSVNSYNCFHCVNCVDSVNCLDVSAVKKMTNCLDVVSCGIGELIYNCVRCGNHNYFLRNCVACRACSHMDYCLDCMQSKDCFACVGLKNSQFCIFNKQYSEVEYFSLKEKIINLMKKQKIWGQFFPLSISQFEYNNSMAMKWFPISKAEAVSLGFFWEDQDKSSLEYIDVNTLPDNIKDLDPTIYNKIYTYQGSKPFKFLKQEVELLKSLNLALHRNPPIDRMLARTYFLEEPKFKSGNCARCNQEVTHSFSDMIQRKIYCTDCYKSLIY